MKEKPCQFQRHARPTGGLPRGVSWLGIVAALTCFSFAIGYASGIKWLGEMGIDALAFLAVPAWMIWLGLALWRADPADLQGDQNE